MRALLLVSPNNPDRLVCHAREEARRLAEICQARGWAIVADEVFADYPLDARRAVRPRVSIDLDVLSFTLGGASKSLGLPQVKLGWMVVGGPQAERARALAALEIIADTFLSVGTPVQVAAPSLLARGDVVRDQIRRRAADNLAHVPGSWRVSTRPARCCRSKAAGRPSCGCRRRAEEALDSTLLEREHVLVHPGYFFDFPHEAFIVVSLLRRPDQFGDAFARTLRFACSPASSLSEHKG